MDFDKKYLLPALNALRSGKVIALPTDTVYGLGISPLHAKTLDVLYNLKGRDRNKPIAWLIAEKDDLQRYGENVAPFALDLAQRFWPGPLTLIVKASQAVPEAFQSDVQTIGLRVPNHEATRELIRSLNAPLAVTSANLSGLPSAVTFDTLDRSILSRIAMALPDNGFAPSGVASTVVDCTGAFPRILRQGEVIF